MDPQQHLTAITARMAEAGFTVTPEVPLAGTHVLMGQTTQFRWSWMATRMYLLAYVQTVDTVTAAGLESFGLACLEHALAAKGALRGLQVGVAAVPIQIGAHVEDAARELAERKIQRRYAAFSWPVAIDASSGKVSRHTGRPAIGAAYSSWMREQIDAVTIDR